MNWLYRKVLRALQRRCKHPHMIADILEGDWRRDGDIVASMKWCPTCGAYQIVYDPFHVRAEPRDYELRLPDPELWNG